MSDQIISANLNLKGNGMYDKTIRKLQELAENRQRELTIPIEDQVKRIRVYIGKNGRVTFKPLGSIPFQKCLFKNIAPLSELLEIELDTAQLMVTKDNPVEIAKYNRMKFDQFLTMIEFEAQKYYPLGATGSLKDGKIWFGTDPVRKIVHEMFPYSEAAGTYLGILLSQGWEGEFKASRIAVYEEHGENDGQGYIRQSYAKEHGLYRQSQVRIIDIVNRAAGKGTLLPISDREFNRQFGDMDIAINQTMIKTESRRFDHGIVSVRSIAEFRKTKSSFQVLQHVDEVGLNKLLPGISDKIQLILDRFSDKAKAVAEMKIRLISKDNYLIADTKLAMLLLSNLPVDHPWIQNRLNQLWLEEVKVISTGGGLEFHSGMAGYDERLSTGEVYFNNGSVFMNMADLKEFLMGDVDGDLLPFVIDKDHGEAIIIRYPIIQGTGIFKAKLASRVRVRNNDDLVSDPLAVDVLSNHIKRLPHVSSPKETGKKKTSLTCLVSVLLDGALGSSIGSSTLALSAAIAHEKYDLARELTLFSQEEVLSFKHHVEKCAMVSPGKILKEYKTPQWFEENPMKLSDFKPVNYPGIVSDCWNHVASKVASFSKIVMEKRKPLIEFKNLVPIPSTFTRKDFVKVYGYYKRYCKLVSQAIEKKDDAGLKRVIHATEIIGSSMGEKEIAIAWNLAHMASKGIAAFPIHLNINVLVKLLGMTEIQLPIVKVVKDSSPIVSESSYNRQVDLVLRKFFALKAA